MKPCRLLFLLIALLHDIVGVPALITPKHDKVVTCYVASWAQYRKEKGKFSLEDLHPELCTHFIYAFAGIDTDSWTIKSLDPWADITSGNYKKMTELRKSYPHTKFSLAIGGWNEGSKNYSELASSPVRRQSFIASVVDFLKVYEFDGFDLDWEFPGERGGAPYDKENFVSLIKELKRAFKGHNYLLTAAISANKRTIDVAYDIHEISKYLDYIHLMAYDYHGKWDLKVLPNAPLKSKDGLSVEDSVKYLLKKGAPARKLILGLPMYGRTFILATKPSSPNETPFGLVSLKDGFKGPYTNEEGFMGYNEICQELINHPKNWTMGWDNFSSTAYAINEDRVIVYDDVMSMTAKVKFVNELDLAGVMVWSIDTDDFHGMCSSFNKNFLDPLTGDNFPLMRTINLELANTIDNNVPGEDSSAGSNYPTYAFSLLLILTYYL